MNARLKSALIRTLRTYLQVAVPAILAVSTDTGPIHIDAYKAALLSGIPAALAFLWRVLLDPAPVPTLADKNPAA